MPGFDNWLNGFGFGQQQSSAPNDGTPPSEPIGKLDLSDPASSGLLLFLLLTEDL